MLIVQVSIGKLDKLLVVACIKLIVVVDLGQE